MAVQSTTQETFAQDVLESEKPVLVDFWAEWCGPCRLVAPILDQISTEYHSSMKVLKVNVDEEPTLASQYGITSIPTMHVFDKGQVVRTIVGAKHKGALVADLKGII